MKTLRDKMSFTTISEIEESIAKKIVDAAYTVHSAFFATSAVNYY